MPTASPRDAGDGLALTCRAPFTAAPDVAPLLRTLGQLAEAEPRAIATAGDRGRINGFDSPIALSARAARIDLILHRVGAVHTDVLPMVTDLLAAQRVVLGNGHADTIATVSKLAGVLLERGDLEHAERRAREAFAAANALLGEDARETRAAACRLVSVLTAQGRYEDACRLAREDLDATRRVWRSDSRGCADDYTHPHPEVCLSLHNLGALLLRMRCCEEAGALLEEALSGRRALHGNAHPEALASACALADVRILQGRVADARELLKHVHSARTHALGAAHTATRDVAARLRALSDDAEGRA